MNAPTDKTVRMGQKIFSTSFAAYPAEIERWKQKAKARGWTFSQFVRMMLLRCDQQDEEAAARVSEMGDGRNS
jgi:hypothetical protein